MNRLSLVIAAFNEEENLPKLYERIARIDWPAIGVEIEIVIVDDHSRDGTPEVLRDLAAKDSRVKWLRFSRNFGSHKAFTAGLEHATGDAAVILAADLQDPPETVPKLLEKWRAGAKVVWAVRGAREGESFHTKLLARIYYFLMRRYAVADLPETGADFLLMDRLVLNALRDAPERNTSLLALIQWMGFEQASIVYTKEARTAGVSKWTFSKRIKLAVDSFASFSYFPIRLMSGFGFAFAMLGFCYASLVIVRRVFFGNPIEGWASLMCVVLILSGVQLLMLGVLGEYLWRTFDESRRRPRYIVEASHGFERKTSA
jgi:glycosyltransferase involved in cell wall biosynthesis